ncbi:hypothetical protein BJ138DRAFT_1115122 [Hygrophoropsis aurantiaca]|uniref:Uncharacterized protein n=1 Tax=Hygrophoropsis aurantiaca TaxID=72124 RepID=A0ACB8A789_9AGAM|nr:hypothetical protein BJ138DRAFT_1115122 [Hygrophoropsis aurantiaca]
MTTNAAVMPIASSLKKQTTDGHSEVPSHPSKEPHDDFDRSALCHDVVVDAVPYLLLGLHSGSLRRAVPVQSPIYSLSQISPLTTGENLYAIATVPSAYGFIHSWTGYCRLSRTMVIDHKIKKLGLPSENLSDDVLGWWQAAISLGGRIPD